MDKAPKVFISYSWKSEEYKSIVLQLAEKLKHDSVDVILDQWDLHAGHDIYGFMLNSIRVADKVLILCEKSYVEKANDYIGGAGVETQIITPAVFANSRQEKFIPVFMEGHEIVPDYLRGRMGIPFQKQSDEEYKVLLNEIRRVTPVPKPKPTPDFAKKEKPPKPETGNPNKKPDWRKILFWALSLLAVALLAVCVVVFLKRMNSGLTVSDAIKSMGIYVTVPLIVGIILLFAEQLINKPTPIRVVVFVLVLVLGSIFAFMVLSYGQEPPEPTDTPTLIPTPTPTSLTMMRYYETPDPLLQVKFSDASSSSTKTEITPTGEMTYKAEFVIKDDKEKYIWPWIEGKEEDAGIDEYLYLSFSEKTTIDTLGLYLGFGGKAGKNKNDTTGQPNYQSNNRPHMLQFDFSDGSSCQIPFDNKEYDKDHMTNEEYMMQYVKLSQPVTTWGVKITIKSVYDAEYPDGNNDTCIFWVKAFRPE